MVFDAHSDIWCDVTDRRLRGERDVFSRRHLPRLQAGGVEGGLLVFWLDPVYSACPLARTQAMMESVAAEARQGRGWRIVCNRAQAERAAQAGEFYIFLGIEGLAPLGEDLSLLEWYHAFGCRHAMLTWNEANALAAGAMSGEDRGLTALGREAVKQLQRRRMLLDVSHLNEAGFWDVVSLTQAPFLASHSNARALCDVPRNLTDPQLRAIRDAGGVVGLNAFGPFLSTTTAEQTVETLALHAVHMVDVMGIDHVCCGFDFLDYLEGEEAPLTRGLETCAQIPNLFSCLEKLGMNRREREQIARRNILRLLGQTVG